MNGTHAIQTELISYRINHLKVAAPAVILGGATLGLAAVLGFIGGWPNFFHAYLAAYLFWFGLTVGCIALTMLHHLTGGRWGDVLRPLLETGARGLIPMAILFIPILIGMTSIYPWAQPYEVLSKKLQWQHDVWASKSFFTVRAVIYFLILGTLAFLLNRKYRLRDEMAVQDPAHNTGLMYRLVSGPGILIMGVVITLAMVDWAMSVQAGWYSTMYGLNFIAGQALSCFALMVIIILLITRHWEQNHGHGRHGEITLVDTQTWHDLGNLLLAFTMIWGYLALSQFLIVYSGNLPFEASFYRARSINGWEYIGGALFALHFALPFMLLLMRNIKRDPKKLVLVALFILLIRQLDFYYQIHPSYDAGLPGKTEEEFFVRSAFGWHTVMNLLTPIGIGGLWIAFFAWNLKDRRVLPAPAQEAHHHG